ncbi:autotransporter domain-containing protein [Bradyrhizobium sp. AUGA SZCCT0176]|uniref:autotransporter outer membrane beta-barrel domain-containing protein n=1 Tax=Bradyrhizobium sp. AUGA SZCCT0176 TaxID=2807664 RepID=UPI001BA486A9|nr:autotransporter outer membrane beta-barrel domain-containing protein [Bradyrhizobium sp. AUGA SZCCT0176]MBR1228712.1 autotransporter domain-containing protein [Bradyrhizobium sp. AUGA SZCCT0176]
MSSGNASALRRRVLLSGTMLVAAVTGYGRRAYGACDPSGGSTYQCSGAEVTTQTINANNASVSTVAGFSVNTAAGHAITITGDGALSYTDTNASSLTAAAGYALNVRSNGDFAGTPGSVTIATNGALSGAAGIVGQNNGTGALTITANGNVTGAGGNGIFAQNNSGTALTVTTGAGTTVSGGFGIRARNFGTGALTVTANGDVTGTSVNGIYAQNNSGTALSVTTGAGTTVSGNFGILARNFGTGALTITASGNVTGTSVNGIYARNTGTDLTMTTGAGTTVSGGTNGINARHYGTGALTIAANGDVTGTAGNGIDARNIGAGTTLTVTTGAGTTVSGTNGIFARHYGTGALTIAANGDVTGTSGVGIDARNTGAGTTLTVTTGAGTTVSGANGIFAQNYGTGALTITANGNVTGTSNRGINAYSSGAGTNLTVTTGAGTAVSGGNIGIFADNQGTGALTITANGNVTGTNDNGIFAYNSGAGTNLSVTTAAGATVSGSTNGIFAQNYGTGALAVTVAATSTVSGTSGFGIQARSRPATVTVAGTVTGGGGTAIQFDQAGAFANRLELVTGAVINGNVLGGIGTDTLGLSGTGSGSFNVAQLSSFEAGEKTGSGSWTLTGANAGIGTFAVSGGTLAVNGSLSNAAFTVSGGTLSGTGTVGNTLVSGGTFAPGSGTPGSSMTVSGTLGFNAAAAYAININPTTSSFANVSGVATLGGATVNANFATGSYIAKQYTILTAGSVSGTFNPTVANTNLPANFHDTLSYDATHAYLNLILSFTTPASGTLNGNQNNVANALINSFNSNGGIPLTFATLSAPALSQASGQPGASTSQAGITGVGQFINGVFDGAFGDGPGQGGATGFAQEEDNANAYSARRKLSREAKEAYAAVTPRDRRAPSFEQRWAVWASAYGGNSRVNGDTAAGTNSTTNRVFGAVAGASYHFTPDTQAGFSLGGAGSSFDIANGFGGGRADAFNAAVYAKHNWGAAYVAGLLGYSWQDATTDRTVTIAGVDKLHASFQAQALATRLEGGWRYATPMAGITPYAALQTTTFYLPSYGETATSGSNTFALNYASKSVTATRSELGAKFDKATPVQGGVFTLKARAAWAHDWNTDRSATATFQTLPGATFSVNGALPSADAALASLGAEMKWHNGWTVAGRFDGEFSHTTAGYAAKGSVRYAW